MCNVQSHFICPTGARTALFSSVRTTPRQPWLKSCHARVASGQPAPFEPDPRHLVVLPGSINSLDQFEPMIVCGRDTQNRLDAPTLTVFSTCQGSLRPKLIRNHPFSIFISYKKKAPSPRCLLHARRRRRSSSRRRVLFTGRSGLLSSTYLGWCEERKDFASPGEKNHRRPGRTSQNRSFRPHSLFFSRIAPCDAAHVSSPLSALFLPPFPCAPLSVHPTTAAKRVGGTPTPSKAVNRALYDPFTLLGVRVR